MSEVENMVIRKGKIAYFDGGLLHFIDRSYLELS